MQIDTLRFGVTEIDEERIIQFTAGIPPFAEVRRFAVVAREEELPFQWLQAVDDPALAFVVVDPRIFFPAYAPQIAPADREELGLDPEEAVQVLVLLVLGRTPRSITANLLAPVVISPRTRTAKQVVLEGGLDRVRVPLPLPQVVEAVPAAEAAG